MMTNKREPDMSPIALGRRREEMRQLYKLMMYLRRARLVGPVEPAPKPGSR
jgi:hypothetical protein